jgi:hypothetical protein
MRPACNKTAPATLVLTGPACLDLTQSVVHTQKGVGPGEHSGNPSAQHPITMSPFDRHALATTTANFLSKLYLSVHIVNLLSHTGVTNSHANCRTSVKHIKVHIVFICGIKYSEASALLKRLSSFHHPRCIVLITVVPRPQRVLLHNIRAVAPRQPSSPKTHCPLKPRGPLASRKPSQSSPTSLTLNPYNQVPNDTRKINPRHRAKGVNCRSEDWK